MNKVILASALGVGGTGTCLTGAYALGMFGGGKSLDQVSNPAMESTGLNLSGEYNDWWIHNDLGNFKNRLPKDCVKKVFPGITKGLEHMKGYQRETGETTNQKNIDSDFSFSGDKDLNGCLTVIWNRKEPQTKTDENKNKYSGDFTLLWSFSQDDKGFINFSKFSFDDTGDGDVRMQGAVYALEKKKNGSNEWEITAQYEGGKDVDNGRANNKVPKPGKVLSDIKDLNFWGLAGQDETGRELVKENELRKNKQEIENKWGGSYWRWIGKKGEEKITDWSSNISTWWAELFSECNNKVLDKVKGITTGKWERVAIEWDKESAGA